MKKEKTSEEINEEKEEKAINKWLPIGLMIGTVIGIFCNFAFDNLMYLGYGIAGGLIIGIFIASIVSEKDDK